MPNRIKGERKIKVYTDSNNLYAYLLVIRKFKNFKSDKVDKWKIKILFFYMFISSPKYPAITW